MSSWCTFCSLRGAAESSFRPTTGRVRTMPVLGSLAQAISTLELMGPTAWLAREALSMLIWTSSTLPSAIVLRTRASGSWSPQAFTPLKR